MYNSIVKNVLLSGAILLWVASASYSWVGPCLPFGACGGHYTGENTCAGTSPYCEGSCPWHCATGGSNQYCAGLWDECG